MRSCELRDGRVVSLRPIEPDDAEALVAFHRSLSDTSRRYRFFTLHPELSADEVERFTHVDHRDREAIVALAGDAIVGVGRFDRTKPEAGEVAFVVNDDWQAAGLGTLLLRQLAEWAREHHVRRFEADCIGDNRKMLTVFAHWSPSRTLGFDAGVIHLDMPMPEA